MPLYEFFCPKCGKIKEELQNYDDPAPTCEEGKVEMKRQLSNTMERKGGGLYSIDTPSSKNWGDLE